MKKITLLAIMAFAFSAGAQNWVDTTVQSKKAILEEFTGMYCGYCPDGHRIANELVKNNPGKLFLINIHSGNFARPQTGAIDLRTSAGDAIDAAAGITGYPSGTVNRSTTPWAQNRGDWAKQVTAIVGQTSPVNVKVKAFVDLATRLLTTEVEVYYTSNSATAKNALTVALTQDDILGPQTDYGDYNPQNWKNGLYRHNHVLRQLITEGNFGEVIDTTTKGHYVYRKYTTTIPESYKDVKAVLHKLNVVAFVAEGNNNILSGDETAVDFDPAFKTDLNVKDVTVTPGLCGTSVTPRAEVINELANPVNGFTIMATVNGTSYRKVITQVLAPGEKTTVEWEPVSLSGGKFSYSLGDVDSIVGGGQTLFDVNANNNDVSYTGNAFKAAPVPANNVWCGFETMNHTALDLSVNGQAETVGSGTTKYGSWSTSALLCYLHESWNVSGKAANILLGKVKLSDIPKPGMAYMYAYSDGKLGGTAPVITVSISKDCGATWTQVSSITAEETGQPANSNSLYIPAADAYKLVKIDLDAYQSDEILARVSVTPGTNGNALYVDEISFSSFAALGIQNNAPALDFDVYPNPANGNFTINLPSFQNASYVIMDITGKRFMAANLTDKETEVNCKDLKSGIYFIEVNANGAKSTRKIVITE